LLKAAEEAINISEQIMRDRKKDNLVKNMEGRTSLDFENQMHWQPDGSKN
jgi:hypothetical protein